MYQLIILLGSLLYTGAALRARRTAGTRGVTAAWLVASTVFALLGYLDWRHLVIRETPLESYVMLATLPTLCGALFVAALGGSRISPVWQWLAAATLCTVTNIPAILLGLVLAHQM